MGVGATSLIVAIASRTSIGETLAADSRSAPPPTAVARNYGSQLVDMCFLAPALTVSLIIGGLIALFAAAPAILIDGFGLGPLGLSVFFAATVIVVFSGGLLAPWFARTIGQARATLMGAALAFIGSALVLSSASYGLSLDWYTVSLTVFLFGMGLTNPLGTALALQPFGNQAGLASALLGFLQMAFAALATTAGTLLPWPASTAIGIVLVVYAGIAVVVFRLRPADVGNA